MTRITFASNLVSKMVERNVGQATDSLRAIFERLSTGQRINRASDDAAGLAIASSLNADVRTYSQAIRNLNDGISLLNISQGVGGELTGILQRLRELAIQSSNGTFSTVQRRALNEEAEALTNEYNRVLSAV